MPGRSPAQGCSWAWTGPSPGGASCAWGLPGKSGIGGGIVTAAPGKGGMGTWSPPLDDAGNSVRGVLAAQRLSRALGVDLFASPVVAAPADHLTR